MLKRDGRRIGTGILLSYLAITVLLGFGSLVVMAQELSTEDQVQQIYIAYYGRPADPDGQAHDMVKLVLQL